MQAILKNARQIYDEVSHTWLIENMSYASSSSAIETNVTSTKRKAEVQEGEEKAVVKKALTIKIVDKNLEKIVELEKRISEVEAEFVDDNQQPQGFFAHLPSYVRPGLEAGKMELEAMKTLSSMLKDSNKCENFRKIVTDFKALPDKTRETLRRCKLQTEEAKAYMEV